jgi:hypothetical protein
MRRKLEIGDIVECINPGYGSILKSGEIYVVTGFGSIEYDTKIPLVYVNSIDESFFQSRFKFLYKGDNDAIQLLQLWIN